MLKLIEIGKEHVFPPTSLAQDGLLCFGGDLSPERLIAAYTKGIFPWYNPGEPILWWTPDPRCIFLPGEVKQSKNLRKMLRQNPVTVTADRCFSDVIQACATAPGRTDATWIGGAMTDAYKVLHRMGYAHSFEVWDADGTLSGGLYGIVMGGAFFGESMFSLRPQRSKAALIALHDFCIRERFFLIDGQVVNPYLMDMGAKLIPRSEFEKRLAEAISLPLNPNFPDFTWSPSL